MPDAAYTRAYRALKAERGECRECRRPSEPGHTRCGDHLDAHAARYRRRRQPLRVVHPRRRSMTEEELETLAEEVLAGKSRSYVAASQDLALAFLARRGIVLPGWDCKICGAFNGSAKETLTECRCCGKEKS
jgi:hypothetical protein